VCTSTWTMYSNSNSSAKCSWCPGRWAEGYGATVMSNEELPGVWTLTRMDQQPVDLSKVRHRSLLLHHMSHLAWQLCLKMGSNIALHEACFWYAPGLNRIK
jgi:hypothetical protein